MYVCVAGDTHGALNALYDSVLALESRLGVTFAWVLQVGDFGYWPDSERVDKATRKHEGAGDLPSWIERSTRAPRKTLFIKGNHEDFLALGRTSREVLPNLFYLANGDVYDIGKDENGKGDSIRVGGVGGCFGPSSYERKSSSLQGYAQRHYTQDEIEMLVKRAQRARCDFIMTHDAPTGVVFPRHRQGFNWASTALGLGELLRRTKPLMCFFGHHHTRVESVIHGVPCIGLNKSKMPGHLVAVDLSSIIYPVVVVDGT